MCTRHNAPDIEMNLRSRARANKGPINQLRTARSENRALAVRRNSESLISDEIDIGLHALLRILPAPLPYRPHLSLLARFLRLFLVPSYHIVPDLPSYSDYNQEGNESPAYFWHQIPDTLSVCMRFSPRVLTFTLVATSRSISLRVFRRFYFAPQLFATESIVYKSYHYKSYL